MTLTDLDDLPEALRNAWACESIGQAETYIASSSDELVLHNFIGNAFQLPSASASEFLPAINPKTGRVFAQVPVSPPGTVDEALQSATAAFSSWSRTSAAVRSTHLKRIADLLEANRERFAIWESLDQGKTLARARVEVDRAVSNFRYFSTFILHQETRARMIDGSSTSYLTYEHRSPAGVFALISPWNMPLYLLTWKIAPCLAFGCTAVAKPSEVTSMTAFLLCAVFREAGLPPGVINVVFGNGPVTGAALVQSRLVRGVSFTGGTATGIQIRRDTAAHIDKHLSLELGGKNPTLVFADVAADDDRLARAVQTAAAAAFENQGEICLCGSRIYVQSALYDRFVAAYAAHVAETYRCGERVGAVVSLPHYRKIRSYLQLAVDEEATFVLGAVPAEDEPDNGLWIDPVVLTDVSTSSRIMREEIFGPVVTIAPLRQRPTPWPWPTTTPTDWRQFS